MSCKARGIILCTCCALCVSACSKKSGSRVVVEPDTTPSVVVLTTEPESELHIEIPSVVKESETESESETEESIRELTSIYESDIQKIIQSLAYSLMADESYLRSYTLEAIGERKQLSSVLTESEGLTAFIRDCCWTAHEGGQLSVEVTGTNFVEPYMFYTDTKTRLNVGVRLKGDTIQSKGFVFQFLYENDSWKVASVREGYLSQSTVLVNEDGSTSRLEERGLDAYVLSLDSYCKWADYIDQGFILVDDGALVFVVWQTEEGYNSKELCSSSSRVYCVGNEFLVNEPTVEVTDESVLGTYIQDVPSNAVCTYTGTRRVFSVHEFIGTDVNKLEEHVLALDKCIAKDGPGSEKEYISYAFDGECYSVNGVVDTVKEQVYKETIDRINTKFTSGTVSWRGGGIISEASDQE